jgi:hypothetical protein
MESVSNLSFVFSALYHMKCALTHMCGAFLNTTVSGWFRVLVNLESLLGLTLMSWGHIGLEDGLVED